MTKDMMMTPTDNDMMKGTRMLSVFFVMKPNNAINKNAPAVMKKLMPTVLMKSAELVLLARTTMKAEETNTPMKTENAIKLIDIEMVFGLHAFRLRKMTLGNIRIADASVNPN